MYAASTPVFGPHYLARVTLADGRVVAASGGHPTSTGAALGSLRPGDALSGSVVKAVGRVRLEGKRTFDVLPSGSTGACFTQGVVLGSSFWRSAPK